MLARSWRRGKCSSAGGSWSSSTDAASRTTCRAGRDGSCSRSSSRTATGRSTRERAGRGALAGRTGRRPRAAPVEAAPRRAARRAAPGRAASSGSTSRRRPPPCTAPESALALGDPHEAWGPSQVAMFVAGRPFLAGEEAPWIDEQRRSLSRAPRARARGVRRRDARRRRHRAGGRGAGSAAAWSRSSRIAKRATGS